ncbi:hypothetical protein NMG60_11030658 [Bertholletia excelsa]
MESSFGDDFGDKESLIPVVNESRQAKSSDGMDVCQNGAECNTEFRTIEHPIEPLDEDQPVKCPVPDSLHMNFSVCLRKRTKVSSAMHKDGVVVTSVKPLVQAVRKRHHASINGDHGFTSLLRNPSRHPLSDSQHYNRPNS